MGRCPVWVLLWHLTFVFAPLPWGYVSVNITKVYWFISLRSIPESVFQKQWPHFLPLSRLHTHDRVGMQGTLHAYDNRCLLGAGTCNRPSRRFHLLGGALTLCSVGHQRVCSTPESPLWTRSTASGKKRCERVPQGPPGHARSLLVLCGARGCLPAREMAMDTSPPKESQGLCQRRARRTRGPA